MSKEESKMLQGISVLAMVCLHLFDNLNYSDLFTPLIMLKGYPLIFILHSFRISALWDLPFAAAMHT